MTKLKAPWTQEQIDNLDKRQERLDLHPYTCICGHSLEPGPDGWHCEMECGYTQDWCHAEDANGDFLPAVFPVLEELE